MKQPPRLLGFAHGTFILAFFSYFILACVPTSEYQDPASGSEIPEQAVIDSINNAAAPEGPLENAYNLNDSALFTLYIKLYSQVQPRAHIDTLPQTKKLLLHKDEIRRLIGKVEQKGYTLLPLNQLLRNSLLRFYATIGYCTTQISPYGTSQGSPRC
jgi:hypothetical protein